MLGMAAAGSDLEDTNYREGDLSRRCNTSLVVAWLRDNYRFGKSGSISKNSVYRHYLDECRGRGLETDINQTYFGKLVKKASSTTGRDRGAVRSTTTSASSGSSTQPPPFRCSSNRPRPPTLQPPPRRLLSITTTAMSCRRRRRRHRITTTTTTIRRHQPSTRRATSTPPP